MRKEDWQTLLERFAAAECTPFLGAGVNDGVLPLGGEIAERWTDEYNYPLSDFKELRRVAQFLAVTHDNWFPKSKLLELFYTKLGQLGATRHGSTTASPADPPEAVSVIASFPSPVYITTNYDDFLMQALAAAGKKPERVLCRWNTFLQRDKTLNHTRLARGINPTVNEPVVFYLHGHHSRRDSLVLTEDDYLDFLVAITEQDDLIPPRIQEAIAGTSLLFVGYSLADWNFRVLLRRLVSSLEASVRSMSVAVQLPPVGIRPGHLPDAQAYLERYFGNMKVSVAWQSAREFSGELLKLWTARRTETEVSR